jgi:5,6-dimethylbenzimidazole synthase
VSAFSQPEIDAVYRAIEQRRDIRHFRPDPKIEDEQGNYR